MKLNIYGGPHHGLVAKVLGVSVGQRIAVNSMAVPGDAATHRERRTDPNADFRAGKTVAVYEVRLASATHEVYLGFVESLAEPSIEIAREGAYIW